MKTHIETERRFLVDVPEYVFARCVRSRICQTYLLSDEGAERVRSRTKEGYTTYTHTIKKGAGVSRLEMEEEIGEAEYDSLLRRADPARRPIEKTRYCLYCDGLCFEIDEYPEWPRQRLLEVELERADQAFIIPESIRVLREITGDEAYSNYAMSLSMPPED